MYNWITQWERFLTTNCAVKRGNTWALLGSAAHAVRTHTNDHLELPPEYSPAVSASKIAMDMNELL